MRWVEEISAADSFVSKSILNHQGRDDKEWIFTLVWDCENNRNSYDSAGNKTVGCVNHEEVCDEYR